MKNRAVEAVKSKVYILVSGKNVSRFILKLYKHKIPLLSIVKKNRDEVILTIYFRDYEELLKLNTVYEISIVKYGGWLDKKKKIKKNIFILTSIVIALFFLYTLSRMIFQVEIVTNNSEMRQLLTSELKKYHIAKYKFQKSYREMEEIKEKILEDYKEEIEWIELERVGTKYIVRYEPRIIQQKEKEDHYRHLIAKKNAVIIEVESSKGQVIRRQNDYVKKGDIIVSGYIYLYDEIKDTVSATGTVYGETWYEVEVFYPFGYYEQTKTGRVKTVYSFELINHKFDLFNFRPFSDKVTKSSVLLGDRALNIRLLKEYQEEVNTISSIYTLEEASLRAIDLAVKKIDATLGAKERILKYQVMNQSVENNGVTVKIFFSVCEDITDYLDIVKPEDNL